MLQILNRVQLEYFLDEVLLWQQHPLFAHFDQSLPQEVFLDGFDLAARKHPFEQERQERNIVFNQFGHDGVAHRLQQDLLLEQQNRRLVIRLFSLHISSRNQNTFQGSQTEIVVRLTRQLVFA